MNTYDKQEVAIQIKNLSATTKLGRLLYANVNMNIHVGEIVALVGLSGSGKSVFAKTMAGIIPNLVEFPVTGEVYLYGNKLDAIEALEKIQTIGYIFQNPDDQIFSSIVEEELAFGPENLCLSREEIEERIVYALEAVHMIDYRFHNTNELSGGQKQLIAIASILTMHPKILICDEILSQLDELSCERIVKLLQKLREDGMTIFMIEHDLEKIKFVDTMYHMKNQSIEVFTGEWIDDERGTNSDI
ncbi:MAG: ABC transporter ATP-binding protein [Lachnospiraceae bacterium]